MMKAFIILQALIVSVAVIAGCYIRSTIHNVGTEDIKHYEDIISMDFDVITTADAAGTKHFRGFEESNWIYDSNYSTAIFVCRAEDSFKCSNDAYTQKVTIEKPISGSCPDIGESIEITVRGGVCRYPRENYFYNEYLPDSISGKTLLTILYLEGMNFMKPGHSYLVACQTTKFGAKRYYGMAYGETCWFDLAENHDLIITEPFKEISYKKYSDNEFFCQNESTLRSLLSYKKKVLDKYGLDLGDPYEDQSDNKKP